MKEIKAIIRPHRLDTVLEALHTHPKLPGVTVTPVRGFGRTVGRNGGPAGAAVQYGTVEMTKLECVVNDQDVDEVVDLIQQAARTGVAGDGKITVYEVTQVVKIRTGARMQRIE
ncbi:MAG: P-II family nitrogen regulator [Planctomycetota bacterium]|nr:MAG: P-II family nitrogen regulator [Planctomycetota bacterium]